jgi:peptidoglycan/LPS O-acetylase OafA/YrhL
VWCNAGAVTSRAVPASPEPDFPALTSLRWLAALLVFVYHFPPPLPPGPLHAIVHEGHVGVGIFFVLSGFLITLRYFDAVTSRRVGLREYLVKRVARIVPLYHVVLALSLLLSTGALLFEGPVLAEWTLTQRFFRQVFANAYVPTSWSLTVEECFYFSAPLVFFALAAADGRSGGRPLRGAAVVLMAATAAFFAAGLLLLALPDAWRQRAWGFFGDPEFMVRHTLFGRFFDFAAGTFAALAWRRSLRLRRLLLRPGAATALATGGLGLVALGEWLMEQAGGIKGETWPVAWRASVLVTLGAAVLIVALTRRESLAGRAFGVPPLVYAGKISYALYLVQLTPLGKGLLFPIAPAGTFAYLPFMYLGMTAVSAALYEIVERPAHAAVLRLAGYARAHPVRPRARLGWAAALTVGAVFAVQLATALAADVSRDEALRAAAHGRRSLVVQVEGPTGFRIPEEWVSGPAEVRRSPPLLVWADGVPIPLITEGSPPPGSFAAYRSGHRGRFLTIQCALPCQEATVVRDGPGLRLVLAGQRLRDRTPLVLAVLLSAALVAALARQSRVDSPAMVAGAATVLLAWFAASADRTPWAAAALGSEVLLLVALAAAGRLRASRAPLDAARTAT